MTTIIVGLGNHGMKPMRHSIGNMVVNSLASVLGLSWRSDRQCCGFICETENEKQEQIILLKPRLLMNVNGRSIAKTAQLYRVTPDNIFVIHDELDYAVGKVSIKQGGSANGHNGVKSAINSLRSDVMHRLRVGIGRPTTLSQISPYVLDDFIESEMPLVMSTVDDCVDIIVKRYNLVTATDKLVREQKDDRTKG
ncbi:probable peptidyl-tRNA hydrolase [Dysidea avara]|uniref:probable peptidyl-tRNA hydrolase n=1 Tax=Dysidea avara TaxID=196820 RepID=UPI0033310872